MTVVLTWRLALLVLLFLAGPIEAFAGDGVIILSHSSSVIGQPDVLFKALARKTFIPDQDAGSEPRKASALIDSDTGASNPLDLIWAEHYSGRSPSVLARSPFSLADRRIVGVAYSGQNSGAQTAIAKADVKFQALATIAIDPNNAGLRRLIDDVRPQLSLGALPSDLVAFFRQSGGCPREVQSIEKSGEAPDAQDNLQPGEVHRVGSRDGHPLLGFQILFFVLGGYSLTPLAGFGFFWWLHNPDPKRRIAGAVIGWGSLLGAFGLVTYGALPAFSITA